jgi:large subunit ribosomal protein L28
MISGKRYNSAHNVSHSNVKTKKRQAPNLQWKRFYLEKEKRWVRLRVATSVLKTINKHGLEATIVRYGADPAILKG